MSEPEDSSVWSELLLALVNSLEGLSLQKNLHVGEMLCPVTERTHAWEWKRLLCPSGLYYVCLISVAIWRKIAWFGLFRGAALISASARPEDQREFNGAITWLYKLKPPWVYVVSNPRAAVRRSLRVKFHVCFCFQTHQPVFIQLLQSAFRIYNCTWPNPTQKASVESCIKTLAEVGRCQVLLRLLLFMFKDQTSGLTVFNLTLPSWNCVSRDFRNHTFCG